MLKKIFLPPIHDANYTQPKETNINILEILAHFLIIFISKMCTASTQRLPKKHQDTSNQKA